MVLAVYKAAVIWKEEGKFRGLHLINVLLQDQILYFIVYKSCLLMRVALLIIYKLGLILALW